MDDFVIPLSSPLDTLVHRTSSRRRPDAAQMPVKTESGRDSQYTHVPFIDVPPRRLPGHQPQSPLLHTRFRTSVETQSTFNNPAELHGYAHERMASSRSQEIPCEDDVSVYSTATSLSIPDPLSNAIPVKREPVSDLNGDGRDLARNTPPFQPSSISSAMQCHHSNSRLMDTDSVYQQSDSISGHLPTVVVSAEDLREVPGNNYDQERMNVLSIPDFSQSLVGRTPSVLPKHLNFSRPVRLGGASEDSKRQVLARNAFRQSEFTCPNPQLPPQPSPMTLSRLSGLVSPLQEKRRVVEMPPSTSMSSITPTSSLVPPMHHSPGVGRNYQLQPLLHHLPRVTSSPGSLYSTYSYYQLDSPSDPSTSDLPQVQASPHTSPIRTPSPLAGSAPRSTLQQLDLADQLLQEGIQHHEANRLREAAIAFERSAITPGGSGVGMLMWGLTLRHGWGCPKDESLGFSWLRRAAEAAVDDLENARAGFDISAVRGELVLAIYEVGQCFFQGWGVKKDQKMAVSYFQIAAKLGDVDAQEELAFCYANGRGCKKDRKEAAKWYRAAVAQGASDVGLAWIYKEKFK